MQRDVCVCMCMYMLYLDVMLLAVHMYTTLILYNL